MKGFILESLELLYATLEISTGPMALGNKKIAVGPVNKRKCQSMFFKLHGNKLLEKIMCTQVTQISHMCYVIEHVQLMLPVTCYNLCV